MCTARHLDACVQSAVNPQLQLHLLDSAGCQSGAAPAKHGETQHASKGGLQEPSPIVRPPALWRHSSAGTPAPASGCVRAGVVRANRLPAGEASVRRQSEGCGAAQARHQHALPLLAISSTAVCLAWCAQRSINNHYLASCKRDCEPATAPTPGLLTRHVCRPLSAWAHMYSYGVRGTLLRISLEARLHIRVRLRNCQGVVRT